MSLLGTIFHSIFKNFKTERMVSAVIRAHVARLNDDLSAMCGNRVISGPFQGMVLPDFVSWGDGSRGPKLLGTYEADLHESLSRMVAHHYSEVINIGCAEGYYAVGLARLLRTAAVYAFDISAAARQVCQRAAEINGVSERVIVRGLCTQEDLESIIRNSSRPLVVSDCEGAELLLLDPVNVPGLSKCDILVETHDLVQPNGSFALEDRLAATHDLVRIAHGPRNPHTFEQLSAWKERDVWLLVNENRRQVGRTWLICQSKCKSPASSHLENHMRDGEPYPCRATN